MKKRAWLIFNPVAGRGNGEADLATIEGLLSQKLELHVLLTSREESGERLAREAIECGAQVVIASGGDGTLSAVAEVLAGTDVQMGIIPRGTANSVAMALQLPQDIQGACRVILEGRGRKLDTARCNGRTMILLAGIGYGARMIENASREDKNKMGVLAYVLSGLKQLGELEHFDAELETDQQIIRCRVASISVANLAPPISVLAQGPEAVRPDDGLLDITLIAAQGIVDAVSTGYHLLWTALRDQPAQRENIGFLRARKVRITTDPVEKVMVDGEIVEQTPVEIECLPANLEVLVDVSEPVEEIVETKLEGLPELEVEVKR